MKKRKITAFGIIIISVIFIILAALRVFVPAIVEQKQNKVIPHSTYEISDEAFTLHNNMIVMDWHTDSLLWDRNLLAHKDYGHSDVPRMRYGNVAIQMFTAVTKSPSGLNYDKNSGESLDNITLLSLVQTWPPATWTSLKARALYQAKKLQRIEDKAPHALRVVTSKAELLEALRSRNDHPKLVAGLLGIEGAHPLEGDINNVEVLFKAGYRMFGLQHFFDNELGGSLHGMSQSGLTDFGREVIKKMDEMNIIIDVSHSSEAVVKDVLALTQRPIVMSHTGIKGVCNTARNIDDELVKQIAAKGGIIAIGFWDAAACDISPQGIVKMIRFAIDMLGEDHVALGSDFDGAVTTALDTSELAALTQEMMNQNFSEAEIRKVMGENSLKFLAKWLPQQ